MVFARRSKKDWRRSAVSSPALLKTPLESLIPYGHGSTGRDVDAAATLLGRNPEIAKVLNTHRFPLDAAAEAFAFAASDSESLKVVIEP